MIRTRKSALRGLVIGMAAFGLMVATANIANADERIGKLGRIFERSCVDTATERSNFPNSKVEKAFKGSESLLPAGTSAQLWLKAGQSCRIDIGFFGTAPVQRGDVLSAEIQKVAVRFAARMGGTVQHRRKGKGNENFRIETRFGRYTMEMASNRSGKLEHLYMGYSQ
ncbi:MAG: hypothetical protein AAFW87_11125 [Pseudomonadota bacterium]